MHPDLQYNDIVARILRKDDFKTDRTGVGTYSSFGEVARFDLSDNTVPLLGGKRVYWKTAVKEMRWFLRGGTNIRELLLDNVTIWTEWPLKKYRQETGDNISQSDFEARIIADEEFAERWGSLGPVYGKQWRRWLGPDGKEYDQIAELIHQMKHNPNSRRMYFHGWNVPDLSSMALPPCHLGYFYAIDGKGRLNCLLFQRSADSFLGLPFNWISCAALQLMLAKTAGLELGEMVWVGGDVHIYKNHVQQVQEQMSREILPAPKMFLKVARDEISDYGPDDFEVVGYNPHPPIAGQVAV